MANGLGPSTTTVRLVATLTDGRQVLGSDASESWAAGKAVKARLSSRAQRGICTSQVQIPRFAFPAAVELW
jgi:hypothetical protein